MFKIVSRRTSFIHVVPNLCIARVSLIFACNESGCGLASTTQHPVKEDISLNFVVAFSFLQRKDRTQVNGMVGYNKEEVYLYDPRVLLQLDFHKSPAKFDPFISAVTPGETWLKVRPLKDGDYDRGFLQLLSQLTAVGEVSRTQFLTRFSQMKASGDYFVTVIEDARKNEIIGAASLIIERKFIHGCAIRGRLEDVVVNNTYRGKQLGKLIVVTVSLLAEHLGCYKMSLDCKDKLIPFYKTLGYVLLPGNANSMTIRYDESPSINGSHNPASLECES